MKLNKRLAFVILSTFTALGLQAQSPTPVVKTGNITKVGKTAPIPVEAGYFLFPIKPGVRNYLSGTMGEIRSNHFHGGLDIKTDQRIGLQVFAAADGYISRVKSSTYGYGNIIYITHPNGLVTTYGHLSAFGEPLATYMRQKQYEKQQFELELFLEPGQFPVKRGDVIALSGNTGGSGGPHLHFEVRDKEDRLYNPLLYKFSEILDSMAPDIFSLAIQPLNIHSRVNNEFGRAEFKPVKTGSTYTLTDTVYAHGLLGLELQTTDRLDGTVNKNGTQQVTLFVNGKPLYEHYIDHVPFELSRQVSQHIDYNVYKRQGRTFQKAYVDTGNDLPLYRTANQRQGRISISPDSVYQVKLVTQDSYNNTSTLNFVVKGKAPAFYKTLAKAVKKPTLNYEIIGNVLKVSATDTSATPRNVELFMKGKGLQLVPSYMDNSASVALYDLRGGLPDSLGFCGETEKLDFQRMVPPGQEVKFSNRYLDLIFNEQTLYDTLYLQTRKEGDVYTIGDFYTPLLKGLAVTITPDRQFADKSKAAVYYLGTGRGRGFMGGTWNGNTITFTTRNMGKFKVLEDTNAPKMKLLSKSKDMIRFKIWDDLSGINSFNAYVNGKWILMKYEHKDATIWSEKLDKNIPLSGEFVLKVKDNAGNEATYTTTI
ncbi:M23 family metallopeptidase [Pontibacter liquoris]|uniref:M23 family metallopeptidase n=1 Tax=Pontibacter liquoris TaxID=2905677 RepID=UPI001FA7FE48|nr:M23 family metallopeptidase [Pontibacter liquoris]